ncbi:MAG: ABC-type transport system substrate-binding protein [Polaribacter sp.]|jgi:ABC-type transport system substrate-binding protein
MTKNHTHLNTAILFLILFTCFACRKAPKEAPEKLIVNVRLAVDPGKLNPLLSLNGYAEQVMGSIFMGLQEFAPSDYSLRPALARQSPTHRRIETGPFKGGIAYDFEILEEAIWDNGMPVLASDYVFSLKAMFNPEVAAAAYRSFFDFIADVIIDKKNPKRFSVLTNKTYLLSEAAMSSISVYPKHVYDPESLLDVFSIGDLKNDSITKINKKVLLKFANQFQAPLHSSDPKGIVGCGPYKLVEWESGQYIILQKKENWWGDKLAKDHPALIARPDEILYKIIPDNAAALTALKGGQLHVVSEINPLAFSELKQNTYVKENFDLYTPLYLSYYYIALNGKRPWLNDPKVRRAIAHLTDVEQIIKSSFFGLAERVTGPIHPSKPFYNRELPPIQFDIEKARQLLSEAGWTDSDGDGVLDKTISGKQEQLSLKYIYTSDNESGEAVGLLLKQAAERVGIRINIKGMEFRAAVTAYRGRDYDLAYSLWLNLPGPEDMKQLWHTSSDLPNGGNRTGFGNSSSDALIDSIRTTLDEETRKDLYLRIQKRIYDDQPYVFLYAPLERIVINKKFKASTSALRPGFSIRQFHVQKTTANH